MILGNETIKVKTKPAMQFKARPVLLSDKEFKKQARIATAFCTAGKLLSNRVMRYLYIIAGVEVGMDFHAKIAPWFRPYAFQSSIANNLTFAITGVALGMGAGFGAFIYSPKLGQLCSKKADVIRFGLRRDIALTEGWDRFLQNMQLTVRRNVAESRSARVCADMAKRGTYKIPLMRPHKGEAAAIALAFDRQFERTPVEMLPRQEWKFTRTSWKEYSRATRINDRLTEYYTNRAKRGSECKPTIPGMPQAFLGQLLRALSAH